jgi:hypothetical protein
MSSREFRDTDEVIPKSWLSRGAADKRDVLFTTNRVYTACDLAAHSVLNRKVPEHDRTREMPVTARDVDEQSGRSDTVLAESMYFEPRDRRYAEGRSALFHIGAGEATEEAKEIHSGANH